MKRFMVSMKAETYIDVEVEADTKEEAVRKVNEGDLIEWNFDENVKFSDLDFPTSKVLVECLDDENDEFEEVNID